MMTHPLLKRGLYAITDPKLLPDERLVPAVEAAIQGGAVLVQFRDKQSDDTSRLKNARNLKSLCQSAGVPLLINDDADLARRIGADGTHLGQGDLKIAEARRILGADAIIGATCHASLKLAETARDAGADYLAFGRFFPSITKPDAPAATPDIIALGRSLKRPVSAIGGIRLENASLLIAQGIDLLAVIGGLFATDDVEARARAFSQLFESQRPFETGNPL